MNDKFLAEVLCEEGLLTGFAEVRRLINGKAITVNGNLAKSWDESVKSGDIITCGKRKKMVVK